MGCHLSWAFQTDALVLISLQENRKTNKINRGAFPFCHLVHFVVLLFFLVTLVDFGLLITGFQCFCTHKVWSSVEKRVLIFKNRGTGSICVPLSKLRWRCQMEPMGGLHFPWRLLCCYSLMAMRQRL